MIGPVSVQHTDLCHRRIPVLLRPEIILDMFKITVCHRQVQRGVQFSECRGIHIAKTVKDLNIGRLLIHRLQRLRLHHSRLSRINGIDTVRLDPVKLVLRDITHKQIGYRSADDGLLAFI